MKKILFALNQNYDNQIEEKVKEKYIELTGNTFEYKSEYYLSGIWKKLEEENFDILILKEDLEGDSIKTQYLDNMTDQFPNLRIIFIANDEHERDEYIRKLFNLVIYDILFKEDLTLSNLSELIEDLKKLYNKNLLKEFKLIMGRETTYDTKEILKLIKNDATNLTNEDYQFLKELYDKNIFQFKIYTDKRFHIKLYIFKANDIIEDVYAGSANLTRSGKNCSKRLRRKSNKMD